MVIKLINVLAEHRQQQWRGCDLTEQQNLFLDNGSFGGFLWPLLPF